MTLHARKVLQVLLVAATTAAVAGAGRTANHSTKDHLSIGPTGGNGPADVFFSFASGDGARAFFETPESLVAADTDTAYDIYQRQVGTTTLISTGPTGGNGNFDAFPADVVRRRHRGCSSRPRRRWSRRTRTASSTSTSASAARRRSCRPGPTGGNGQLDAFFHDVSTDGSRVFFETEESARRGRHGQPGRRLRAHRRDDDAGLRGHARQRQLSPPSSPASRRTAAASSSRPRSSWSRATPTTLSTCTGARAATTTLCRRARPAGTGRTTRRSADPRGTGRASSSRPTSRCSASDTDTSSDVYERSGGATTLVSAPRQRRLPGDLRGQLRRRHPRVLRDSRAAGRAATPTRSSTSTSARAAPPRSCRPGRRATAASTPASPGTPRTAQRVFFETRGAARGRRHRLRASTCTSAPAARPRRRLSTGPAGGNGAHRRELRGSLARRRQGDRRDDRAAGRQRHRHGQRRLRALSPARPRTSPRADRRATRPSPRSSTASPTTARGSSSTRASRS